MVRLDLQDFLILALGVVLRFGSVVFKKSQEFDGFKFKAYFDNKHLIRWAWHLFCSLSFVLVMPEVFALYIRPNVKMLGTWPDWSLFASGLVGFVGYDFLKIFEKAGVSALDKIGVKL